MCTVQFSVLKARPACSRRIWADPAIAACIRNRRRRAWCRACAEGEVLGVLPVIVGCIQATEISEAGTGQGNSLVGRLVLFNALDMKFRELKLRRDPQCPICGDHPTIKELIDYEQFCGIVPEPEKCRQPHG